MNDGLDLLVLGAHPDDAEVHVGGLLALASDRGLKAAILDLTAGELGTRGTPETRRAEAQAAAKLLGVQRIVMDFPDGRFTEEERFRVRLMAEFRSLRPRVLILPAPEDRHPDHRRAHRLGREAAYYAGLKNYPCEDAAGATSHGPEDRPKGEAQEGPRVGKPWRPEAVAWVGGERPGAPDLLVDVSAVWERRMAAFDAFGSQFDQDPSQPPTRIAHPAFRRGVLGRAMHWGSLRMCDWAEALWCEKPVPPALLRLLAVLESA
ncbi:bacillithiol biosynthesis deacetylase BshB1 [Geothrix rubra]|uniref:Bacillithiol biosynthesis deacetylase BshB1 n=1 Tax=Geothrix rubra TaxID=2927977 RepID=A0ABQ5Q2R5_9BACT|nr:bacillithiol biosynthesis deacetylase BshB1 [Geothrix rubra]GLH68779.1 bacillithiol biosynthesis deacetylase BshB1 [Geothrix rubra]